MITDVNLTEAFEELDNINDDETMDKQRSWDEFVAIARDVDSRLEEVYDALIYKWLDQDLYNEFKEVFPEGEINLWIQDPEPYIHPKFGGISNPALLCNFNFDVHAGGSSMGGGFPYLVKTPKNEVGYIPGEHWELSDEMETILNKGDLSLLKERIEREMRWKIDFEKSKSIK